MNFTPSDGSPANSRNVLGPDVEIIGTISFHEELLFDGVLNGEILTEGTLIVGTQARLEGEILSKMVVVHGTVVGNITATDRCELKRGSVLEGVLKAGRIVVEEGATFIGRSEVSNQRSV